MSAITYRSRPSRAGPAPVPKFVITRADNCINCGKCEKACIYGVHKRSEQDPRKMADPLSHLCKNCFRCVSDCPQRALTMSPGAEYRALGRGIWTPLRISTIWSEAETGKIPVFGAGYRGMFAGPNYDGMWTDMSEIVRPTRDGIHGRESISTCVDLGSKPLSLEFDPSGGLGDEDAAHRRAADPDGHGHHQDEGHEREHPHGVRGRGGAARHAPVPAPRIHLIPAARGGAGAPRPVLPGHHGPEEHQALGGHEDDRGRHGPGLGRDLGRCPGDAPRQGPGRARQDRPWGRGQGRRARRGGRGRRAPRLRPAWHARRAPTRDT